MPTYDSFCRAPLADLACVALPDNAVHTDGSLERLIQRALSTVDLAALSPLDAALATKLSGYDDLPPMTELRKHADALEGIVAKKYWPMPTYQDILMYV